MLPFICSPSRYPVANAMWRRGGSWPKRRCTRKLFISSRSGCISAVAVAALSPEAAVAVARALLSLALAMGALPKVATANLEEEEEKVAEAAVEASRGAQDCAGRPQRRMGGPHPLACRGAAQALCPDVGGTRCPPNLCS